MLQILFSSLLLSINTFAQKDTLNIAVYNSPPFGMEMKTGKIGGLMVELWEDIASEMNVNYQYTVTDMKGLISGLQDKTFDIGLGAISITPNREKLVDFTHAVNPSGTGIAVAKSSYMASFSKKWMPIFFDLLELVFVLIIMLFSSAIIVYFVEKKFSKEEPSERMIKNISDGLWWSAVTMTTVGYGDKVPGSKIGRVLGIIWIFTSIIFFSLFTANASAKLSKSKTQSSINTLDDLHGATVVAVAKSSGEEFLIREQVTYTPKKTIQEAIQFLIDGKADAIVSNVPVLKYHNKVNYKGSLLISDSFLMRNNMGIALQEESVLKEDIDTILLKKIAEPKWQQAVYKYMGD